MMIQCEGSTQRGIIRFVNVEVVMSEHDSTWQEKRLEEILDSNIDAISKVQQVIRLGFEPEIADELVERHQLGSKAPIYYETLIFKDYDER
jgi:hypothetical protein